MTYHVPFMNCYRLFAFPSLRFSQSADTSAPAALSSCPDPPAHMVLLVTDQYLRIYTASSVIAADRSTHAKRHGACQLVYARVVVAAGGVAGVVALAAAEHGLAVHVGAGQVVEPRNSRRGGALLRNRSFLLWDGAGVPLLAMERLPPGVRRTAFRGVASSCSPPLPSAGVCATHAGAGARGAAVRLHGLVLGRAAGPRAAAGPPGRHKPAGPPHAAGPQPGAAHAGPGGRCAGAGEWAGQRLLLGQQSISNSCQGQHVQ